MSMIGSEFLVIQTGNVPRQSLAPSMSFSCMTLPFFLPRDFDPASDVPDASCGITDDRCVIRRVTLLLRRVDDRERKD